jgi:RimJ/RimL family protein N-acetyltransferase
LEVGGAGLLKGEKVTLRPLDLKDVEDMIRWSLDVELNILAGWPSLSSIARMRERFEHRIKEPPEDLIMMAIEVDGKSIGGIALQNVDWEQQRGEIGLAIEKAYWSKGYGKDAVITFLQYVFLIKNIRKATAESYDFNRASISLFKSIGFTQEGLLRSHEFTTGAWRDMYVFGLFRDEFLELYPDRRYPVPQP